MPARFVSQLVSLEGLPDLEPPPPVGEVAPLPAIACTGLKLLGDVGDSPEELSLTVLRDVADSCEVFASAASDA